MGTTAIYTGSFDPLTLGHINIIKRAAHLFDELTVGVIVNPNKKSLFSLEERTAMIQDACKDIPNVRVESFSGLLADYVNERRFDAVVRGLRSTADYDYELQMENVNDTLFKFGTQTVFLMTRPEFACISSSMVKEVASLGGDVSSWVTEDIKRALNIKFGRN